MNFTLLHEPPLAPAADLGPYRAADYFSLSDEPRCELVGGRLYRFPEPDRAHQSTVLDLTVRLSATLPAGSKLIPAPLDVTLSDHSVVQPDVICLSAERLELLTERIEGAPDLIVEVLTPGFARHDRGEKLDLYARSGVREYWIVDPAEKHIEFLLNEGGRFVVTPPERGAIRSRALPGLDLPLVEFWTEIAERLR